MVEIVPEKIYIMATRRLSFAGSTILDITGQRFGKRVAIRPISLPKSSHGGTRWEYKCDCGTISTATICSLKSNGSCFCSVAEANKKGKHWTHGLSYTPEHDLWKSAKWRAKEKGMAFSIEIQDVIIPAVCPLLGIELHKNGKPGPRDESPSIDRIDSSRGYIKGNIQVISCKANRSKSDLTLAEFERIAINWRARLSQ